LDVNQWSDRAYSGCRSCQTLLRRIEGLLARNRLLTRQLQHERALHQRSKDQLAELQRPRTTASNSSLAPSANPIGAAPVVVKKPTGKPRGAQMGHAGKTRQLLPQTQVDEVVEHRPLVCRSCASLLDQQSALVCGRHQVAELPQRAVLISEHRSYSCRCGKCGVVTRSVIPDHVTRSMVGERLCGAIGLLGAWVKGSKRAVAEVLGEVLGCPIALGSVSAREEELSEALAEPYGRLVSRIAAAPLKHVDETGWKLAGKSCWLFVAAGAKEAIFAIEKTRTYPALQRFLGGKIEGIFCTDRLGIYDRLPLPSRGLCWAHIKRDFVALAERGGGSRRIGEKGLTICRDVFGLWRDFKQRRIGRRQMQRRLAPLRREMKKLLEEGGRCGIKKTAGFCRALLKREKALWRFASTPGLEPTNNLAERMLRPAVIWRKKSFGSVSQGGCHYASRMLSVIQTLRLRKRSVLEYLSEAVSAHRRGLPAPLLSGRRRGQEQTLKLPLRSPENRRKIA
jgi:transposase